MHFSCGYEFKPHICFYMQYKAPARPNGIALHDVIITSQNVSVGSDNTVFNITVSMEIVPASCDYNIPLINITLLSEDVPGNYLMDIVVPVFIQ